jgi:hypothetical protein
VVRHQANALSARSPDDTWHLVEAFRRGLREAGFVEGQNAKRLGSVKLRRPLKWKPATGGFRSRRGFPRPPLCFKCHEVEREGGSVGKRTRPGDVPASAQFSPPARLPPYSSPGFRTVPGGPQGRVRRSRVGHCKRVTEISKRKRSPPLWRAHTPRVERVRVLRPPRFLMDTAHV